jgi:hypothetical protein
MEHHPQRIYDLADFDRLLEKLEATPADSASSTSAETIVLRSRFEGMTDALA